MAAGGDLFDEVGRELARHGWHFEPSTTPGGPPSWCLDPQGEVVLSVGVVDGKVSVYAPATGEEWRMTGPEALVAWLDRHQARFTAS